MDTISDNTINIATSRAAPVKGTSSDNSYNIEAHTTNNMKLDRPKVTNSAPVPLIQTVHLYKPSDAENYIKKLNNDIYVDTQKEKTNNGFNFKRYFTIFGIIALITAAVAYFRRGK